jgi:predicted dienelactone hydrolase
MRPKHLCAPLLALTALALGGPAAGAGPVGVAFASYADPQRPAWNAPGPRPVEVTFWYPAAPGSAQDEWRVAFFRTGRSGFEVPLPASPRRFPLLLLSHGTGGSAASMGWLANALATRGYVVAAVNHHGNTAAEPDYTPLGFALWWERARDLSLVLDRIASHPLLGLRVDLQRVGAVGFSLGGYSVLQLAGARTDRPRWQAFCATRPADPSCIPPPEAPFTLEELTRAIESDSRARRSLERAGESVREPRVRAVYALAPALVAAIEPASLSAIKVPLRLAVGDRDEQASLEGNAGAVAAAVPGAQLMRVPGGTHYVFLSPCTPWGKLVARAVCNDPWSLDRQRVHATVAADAAAFFDQALRAGE